MQKEDGEGEEEDERRENDSMISMLAGDNTDREVEGN